MLNKLSMAAICMSKWLKAVFLYIVLFRWVIDIVRWLLGVGGTIAESSFLLATTYVIINLVAHKLVLWMVFSNTNVIDTCNQVALIAFSVLPELIVISAIKKSYEQWQLSFRTRRIEYFIWSVLFTLPTLIFMYMTIRTVSGFVSLESTGQSYVLTGDDLRWRVISGWVYGVSQMLYAEIGKGTLDKMFNDIKHQLQDAALSLADRETTIANLETTSATLQSDMAVLQSEIVTLRIAQAQRKTHTQQKPAPSEHKTSEKTQTHAETHTQESGTQSPNEKHQHFKTLVKKAVLSGQPINIKQFSKAAGLSYNTGLHHKDTIIREITNEHPAIQLVKEA